MVIIETAFKKINNKFLNPDDTGVEVESHNKSFNVINGEVAVSNQIPMDSKVRYFISIQCGILTLFLI